MWTDFFALMDVAGTYRVRDDVLPGRLVLTGDARPTKKECDLTYDKRAVHFSHDAMEKGDLGEGTHTVEDRPRIVSSFLDSWRDACGGPTREEAERVGREDKIVAVERQRQAEKAANEAWRRDHAKDGEGAGDAGAASSHLPPPPQEQNERGTRESVPPQGQGRGQQQLQNSKGAPEQAQAQAQHQAQAARTDEGRRAQEKPQGEQPLPQQQPKKLAQAQAQPQPQPQAQALPKASAQGGQTQQAKKQ
mmetsp:Transcript_53620/g.160511  ORF Transcript_53620/g.160511 Transcript_53620/m.160511 type:complete len:248 (-) Transcript_53620:291-1034(-)